MPEPLNRDVNPDPDLAVFLATVSEGDLLALRALDTVTAGYLLNQRAGTENQFMEDAIIAAADAFCAVIGMHMTPDPSPDAEPCTFGEFLVREYIAYPDLYDIPAGDERTIVSDLLASMLANGVMEHVTKGRHAHAPGRHEGPGPVCPLSYESGRAACQNRIETGSA